MGRWRVTIAGSMGLVALAAAGMAALRHPIPLAASALYSLAIAAFFGAAVAALSRPGRARAIWGSFALCGVGYLWMSLASHGPGNVLPHFLTDVLIDFAYRRPDDQIRGRLTIGTGANSFGGPFTYPYSSETYWLGRPGSGAFYSGLIPGSLYQTAHTLFALATAAAGAILARVLTRTPEDPARPCDVLNGPSSLPSSNDDP